MSNYGTPKRRQPQNTAKSASMAMMVSMMVRGRSNGASASVEAWMTVAGDLATGDGSAVAGSGKCNVL
jgi:hypothetical protein